MSTASPPAPVASVERLRRMGLADLDFVVEQHRVLFPHNPFTKLGERFLARYYRTFLDGPHAYASVSVRDGRPVGYLTGILDTVEHRRLLRRYHGRSLGTSALAAALLRPSEAGPLVRHRVVLAVRRRRIAATAPDMATRPVAVLSHLGLVPDARGTGLGSALVEDFVTACRWSGADHACVATAAGTSGAGGLYERLGWQLQRERATFDGRCIALYELDLRRP